MSQSRLKQDPGTHWAILGKYGLYTGTWRSRPEAIRAHINAFEKEPIPHPGTYALSDDEKQAWQDRRDKGDNAVRVYISYWQPAQQDRSGK